MKITNSKEEDAAEKKLDSLQKKREEIDEELWWIISKIDEIEDALRKYTEEQRARDE